MGNTDNHIRRGGYERVIMRKESIGVIRLAPKWVDEGETGQIC